MLDEIFDRLWLCASNWDDAATSATASQLRDWFDDNDELWGWDTNNHRRWQDMALPLIGENVPGDSMIHRDSFKETFLESCLNAFDEAGKSW